MAEFDSIKLEKAIEYVKRMAEGKNPVNNEMVEEDSVINNPNVIRCLYFIEEVLKEVQKNNGKVKTKSKRKEFPLEHLNNYKYQKNLPISVFTEKLNEGLDKQEYNRVGYNRIKKWLTTMGYIEIVENAEWNNKQTIPTEKGKSIGIYLEERTSSSGNVYHVVMYNKIAQEFIISNMRNILDEIVE